MMADYNGWTDELEDVDVALSLRRQLPKRYRERLLRAVVREILGHVGA